MQVEALKKFTGLDLMFQTPRQNLNDGATAEYAVQVVKFIYQPCVIVQFGVRNTLDDQVLSKMTVKVSGFESENLKVAGVVGLPEGETIKAGETKYLYVVLQRLTQESFPACKMQQKLTMTITEIDVDTEDEIGSYEEDYAISEVQIVMADYVKHEILPSGMFKE
jgi:hypothetical protein